jgi:hypothetical protein
VRRLYRYITNAWQHRRLTLVHVAIYAGAIHMAKKRNAQKTKIKRKRMAKKNKPKRIPGHLNLITYVPSIAT